jgi:quercetin dioxygenase-like cupin family protein
MQAFTWIPDLAQEVTAPPDGIVSRAIFQDDRLRVVAFGFGAGQELSEHTATKDAMLYFVVGDAQVGLGDSTRDARAGTWIHMPANLKHSIKANSPTVMLLVLLK